MSKSKLESKSSEDIERLNMLWNSEHEDFFNKNKRRIQKTKYYATKI